MKSRYVGSFLPFLFSFMLSVSAFLTAMSESSGGKSIIGITVLTCISISSIRGDVNDVFTVGRHLHNWALLSLLCPLLATVPVTWAGELGLVAARAPVACCAVHTSHRNTATSDRLWQLSSWWWWNRLDIWYHPYEFTYYTIITWIMCQKLLD